MVLQYLADMPSDKQMDPFECAISAARQGDAYLAVEKCGMVIRKLKRQKRGNDAFLGTLRLANVLLDDQQWKVAPAAAERAFEAIESDSPLTDEQIDAIYKFVDRTSPNCACESLWSFFNIAIERIGDATFRLRERQVEIASKSDNWVPAQVFYILLLTEKCSKGVNVDADVLGLADVLWRWIDTIEDGQQREFTSQFIISRPVLALLSCKGEYADACISVARKVFEASRRNCEQPLMLFVKIVVAAVERNDHVAFKEACECFAKLTEKDNEISKWVARVDKRRFRQNQAGMGEVIRNVLGSVMGNLM